MKRKFYVLGKLVKPKIHEDEWCIGNEVAEVSILDQNTVVCSACDLVKVFTLRSGVVFTSKDRMKHVYRHWKAYPVENSGESSEFE